MNSTVLDLTFVRVIGPLASFLKIWALPLEVAQGEGTGDNDTSCLFWQPFPTQAWNRSGHSSQSEAQGIRNKPLGFLCQCEPGHKGCLSLCPCISARFAHSRFLKSWQLLYSLRYCSCTWNSLRHLAHQAGSFPPRNSFYPEKHQPELVLSEQLKRTGVVLFTERRK